MSGPDTATGNRALMLEEPLLFEIGHIETTGVDFEFATKLGLAGVEQPTPPSPSPPRFLVHCPRAAPATL